MVGLFEWNEIQSRKKELIESLTPKKETPKKNSHVINMNYPIEIKGDLRRCGYCGVFYPLKNFKRRKPGYDWRCKDCRKSEVYK